MKLRLLCLLAISILLASACGSTEGGAANQLSDRCLIQATTQAIFEYGSRGITGWILVRRPLDIPYIDKEGKDLLLRNYQDVIRPPKVTREDDQATVTFYAWTETDGILAYWKAQVEGETLVFFHGEVIDYHIGAYQKMTDIDRRFSPRKGEVIEDEKVKISLSKKSR